MKYTVQAEQTKRFIVHALKNSFEQAPHVGTLPFGERCHL